MLNNATMAAACARREKRLPDRFVFGGAAVLFCLCAALSGCSREEPQAPAAPSPVSRAEDPAYQKALEDAAAKKVSADAALARARKAYEDAAARDPAGAETERLKSELEKCAAQVEKTRAENLDLVRGRIWEELGKGQ